MGGSLSSCTPIDFIDRSVCFPSGRRLGAKEINRNKAQNIMGYVTLLLNPLKMGRITA